MNELELIQTSVLNCRRIDLYVDTPVLTEGQKEAIRRIQQRRLRGEPLQYILGEADFMGRVFHVNPHVLIPRPETEILVETALSLASPMDARALRVLDLGTGSGNIAVSCAVLIQNAVVDSVDISPEALDVAAGNARKHQVEAHIRFVLQDMRLFLEAAALRDPYDMILANPPYVPSCDMDALPADVRQEPRLALDGGEDGVAFLKDILRLGPAALKPGGCLLMEIGDGQSKFLEKYLENDLRFCEYEFKKDYCHVPRILVARRSAH
ncbi:MAG TPA: peptide chain release factor N(5)-glutamine methyltransferase [Candidatus Omnitrophota bacterium]|nr:peptide chain release factor N(5)-glutamine methyltransferase [Candidatus Omnitrophota bacterium]HQO57299.1 peptide chain release factor N(5)-glutamine methyltransferase [Candidatus Omnitrophota bacterium]